MNRRGFVSLPVLVMVSVGILMVPVVKYIKGEQIVGINQLGTLVDGVDLRGLIDVNDRVEDKGEESVSDINKRIQEKFNKRQAERIEKEEQERSSLRPDNLNDMIQMESEQKKEPSAESQRWQGLTDLYQGKDGAVSDLVQENLPQEIKDYQEEYKREKSDQASADRWQGLADLYQGGEISDVVEEYLTDEVREYREQFIFNTTSGRGGVPQGAATLEELNISGDDTCEARGRYYESGVVAWLTYGVEEKKCDNGKWRSCNPSEESCIVQVVPQFASAHGERHCFDGGWHAHEDEFMQGGKRMICVDGGVYNVEQVFEDLNKDPVVFSRNAEEGELIYFSQTDERWAYNQLPGGCAQEWLDQGYSSIMRKNICGQTAVTMLYATYVDEAATPVTVIKDFYPTSNCIGTAIGDHKDVLEEMGFEVEVPLVDDMNYEQQMDFYRDLVDKGYHVFVRAEDDDQDGHFAIISSYDQDSGEFNYYDPWRGNDVPMDDKNMTITNSLVITPPEITTEVSVVEGSEGGVYE